MKSKRWTKLLLLLAAFALFAAACGGDGDDDATETAETEAPAATTEAMVEEEPMEEEMSMTPGEGVSVTMGRANWSTGYFQAELYKQLLEELGYTVSDPAELELGPNLGYIAMAEGQMDFWANSWYPGHLAWLAGELPDG
ncbi:MAG: hypothetical protein OXH86_08075, partial [Acidimicrobiaceae bacterium]|nr:hypothetical protein [Acidimicrobiaceae bacterium]